MFKNLIILLDVFYLILNFVLNENNYKGNWMIDNTDNTVICEV